MQFKIIKDKLTGSHTDQSSDDVGPMGQSFRHSNCSVLAFRQAYIVKISVKMIWNGAI